MNEDELLDKLKDRANTPKEQFIKYEGIDQFWKMVMEDKMRNGWKFKDEEKYKCWDCRKEVFDVNFDEETKKTCPRTLDGTYLIICDDCEDNEDY